MTVEEQRRLIEAAAETPALLEQQDYAAAVHATIEALDQGRLRVAEKRDHGWTVNAWVKQAILFYFRLAEMRVIELPPFEYFDKIPLKRGFEGLGVRVVPPATVRYRGSGRRPSRRPAC